MARIGKGIVSAAVVKRLTVDRWEDNTREWTGLEFGRSQRAVENRKKWRKLVAKLSVVLQRPSRLRDRW